MVSKGFKGNTVAVLALTDQKRDSPQAIARGDDVTTIFDDQNRRRPLDHLLRKQQALGKVLFAIHQCRYQLGRVDRTARHGVEMTAAEGKIMIDKLIRVVDDTDDANGVHAEIGADDKRLRIAVADASDSGSTLHFQVILFKFGPKR